MGGASYSNFQVPDTPGLPAGTSPDGSQWLPGTFRPRRLNENQNEQNYYGVATYQRSAGDLNYQISAFGRESSVHFTPDPVGDLYFNGVASDVDRTAVLGRRPGRRELRPRRQAHAPRRVLVPRRVRRRGLHDHRLPLDAGGNPTGPPFRIADDETLHGLFEGVYLQDEWKLAKRASRSTTAHATTSSTRRSTTSTS
jgi:hypothetical protein